MKKATNTAATATATDETAVRPLPQIVNMNECEYHLVKRGVKAAMYNQFYQGRLIAIEVFPIKISGGRMMFGTMVPKYETFPGNNALYYNSYGGNGKQERAEAMYNKIENGIAKENKTEE